MEHLVIGGARRPAGTFARLAFSRGGDAFPTCRQLGHSAEMAVNRASQ